MQKSSAAVVSPDKPIVDVSIVSGILARPEYDVLIYHGCVNANAGGDFRIKGV